MFELKWLRRFVRKRTNPIPVEVAHKYKSRLSLLYAVSDIDIPNKSFNSKKVLQFLAWNAFGLVIFQIFRGKADWAGKTVWD